MANTQALMEFHDKGYAGNIYEYGVKRESVTHWGNTNYYSYDGRGSVSDIIDGNGEVQMYHSYEPDGQTTMRFRSYVKNPYRYNAERVDYIPGIADFQYLRARYYTPDTARLSTGKAQPNPAPPRKVALTTILTSAKKCTTTGKSHTTPETGYPVSVHI